MTESHARPHSHHHAGRSAAAAAPAATIAKPRLYNPRHPERTLLYQTIAALVPPPRTHRHRYFGVLAPQGNALPPTPEPAASPKRSPAHYLWAVLIARIYQVFPLLCLKCGAQTDDGVQIEPDWDLAAQPAPDYEVDQRVNW